MRSIPPRGRGAVEQRGAGAAHPPAAARPDPARRRQPELHGLPCGRGALRLRQRISGIPVRRRTRRAVSSPVIAAKDAEVKSETEMHSAHHFTTSVVRLRTV